MKGYILSIWTWVDPLYFKISRLTYPTSQSSKTNILRIRLTQYKGRTVTLLDGTLIKKNDILIKIHLHNVKLLNELKGIKSDLKKGKLVFHYVKQSLPELVQYLEEHKKSDQIKGILGITLLNKGCERLGFEVVEISNPFYRKFKWASFFLINILFHHKKTLEYIVKQPIPSYLFMSKQTLKTMYGK